MDVVYKLNHPITSEQFLGLLEASTLAERRPVDNAECIQGMLDNANLTYTAWLDDKLVGIARCVTDFHYCCYLSDLAVDANIQHSGIGKKNSCSFVWSKPKTPASSYYLPAHQPMVYYPKTGMSHMDRCWILNAGESFT